jgi:hypothetical protein
VEAIALATVVGTIPLVPIGKQDWIWFAALSAAAVVHLEAARGMERIREITSEGTPHNHLQTVWFFAAVVLLPPPLIFALLVISYTHSWVRVYQRRALAHRKIFSVASSWAAPPRTPCWQRSTRATKSPSSWRCTAHWHWWRWWRPVSCTAW